MADKSFGVKEINLIGASGTPTIESPNNLNINAVNVAISTDISVGGQLSLGTGTSISSPGSNILTLGTNSVERVRIDSNGDIGIAKSSPASWGPNIPTIEIKGTASTGGNSTRSGAIAFESGSGSNGYAVLWGQSGGIEIYTGATDRASATYRAKFNSTGNLAFASGNGIDFSATSDASGKTSELLDDYEEGTWTPVLGRYTGGAISASYSTQSGTYQKVGNTVKLFCYVTLSAITSQGSSLSYVEGLPFNPSASYDSCGAIFWNSCASLDIDVCTVHNSDLKIYFNSAGINNSLSSFDWQINSGSTLSFSITYQTN